MAPKPRLTLRTKINALLSAYYENYYRKQLGLVDWRDRIQMRLHEEERIARPVIQSVKKWINYSFRRKRVLVVGAGTGAECVELARQGAFVYAIEPNKAGVEIIRGKNTLYKLSIKSIREGVAESLPYKDNFFDFVFCYTVIEHVADIEKSIDEMLRVVKTQGWVFLQTGDYRFPYEWHYKKPRIPFSPKWLTLIHFALQGRPIGFLRSVNFVTGPQLDRLFMKRNVLTLRVIPPWWHVWTQSKNPNQYFLWFLDRFGIGRDQNVFLRKL